MLATLRRVDMNAVRRADRRVLVELAGETAENALGLLADAEFLLEAGRWARAYSLAHLASEEWAKAYSVLTLSFMSSELRSRIPGRDLRYLLQSHVLKAMGAEFVRAAEASRPGVAVRIAGMPDLASFLTAATKHAAVANAAKERGLYADLLRDGAISRPSDVTEDDAADAVARARQVGASAAPLHDQDALAKFADPPPEALAVADAVFSFWLGTKAESAEAAAAIVTEMAAGFISDGGSAAVAG
jgi:AbiV family abortive infection protein